MLACFERNDSILSWMQDWISSGAFNAKLTSSSFSPARTPSLRAFSAFVERGRALVVWAWGLGSVSIEVDGAFGLRAFTWLLYCTLDVNCIRCPSGVRGCAARAVRSRGLRSVDARGFCRRCALFRRVRERFGGCLT